MFNFTEVVNSNVQCALSELDNQDPNDSCTVLSSCSRTIAINCGKFGHILIRSVCSVNSRF